MICQLWSYQLYSVAKQNSTYYASTQFRGPGVFYCHLAFFCNFSVLATSAKPQIVSALNGYCFTWSKMGRLEKHRGVYIFLLEFGMSFIRWQRNITLYNSFSTFSTLCWSLYIAKLWKCLSFYVSELANVSLFSYAFFSATIFYILSGQPQTLSLVIILFISHIFILLIGCKYILSYLPVCQAT
jgi:hypothetical protein